jgi:hypothetical protein
MSPQGLWPEKVLEKKVEPVSPSLPPSLPPKPVSTFVITNETRLFWTLGLVSIAILILITLSLLLATIQNGRLLTELISRKQ